MNRQSKGISLKKINVTDRFLKREMELARTEVIPYQWEALNDNVEGAEPSFCMRNFKLAAKLGKKRRALGQESLPVWTTEAWWADICIMKRYLSMNCSGMSHKYLMESRQGKFLSLFLQMLIPHLIIRRWSIKDSTLNYALKTAYFMISRKIS